MSFGPCWTSCREGQGVTDLLTYLGTLTLGAGAVILILLLLGRFTRRRYSARWRCLVWLLLALRMAIPAPLLPARTEYTAPVQLPAIQDPILYQAPSTSPSPTPSAPLSPGGTPIPTVPVTVIPQPVPPTLSPTTQPAEPGFTLSLSQILFILWLVGCVSILLWNLFCHARFCRWLKRWATQVSDPAVIQLCNQLGNQLKLDRRPRLMTCHGVTAPMLAGLFHPTILLPPEKLEHTALKFSLLHELTHFRRRDIWLKTLVLWVNALHWFNPLAWLMARAVERDTELACDDSVLQALPAEDRLQYSRTIIDTAAHI